MHSYTGATRVLVADPHPAVRIGLGSLFQNAGDICIVAETGSGLEVLPLVEETKPDVLMLEMELPGLSGVTIAQQMWAIKAPVRLLGFSIHDYPRYIYPLIRSNAAGFLTKDEPPEVIVAAVRGIADGESGWFSRRATARLNDGLAGLLALTQLTQRQQQVLRLVTTGQTNHEIGCELGISAKTVEKHLTGLMVKLHVASRVELAVLAVQKGWLQTAILAPPSASYDRQPMLSPSLAWSG
jgi:DNA-binding NarL/FixJ family response regulator